VNRQRSARLTLLLLLALAGAPRDARAQDAPRVETVTFENPGDRMPLKGMLSLPRGGGPFPGVVLLSLAGVDELIDKLNAAGWAVLLPERRGIHTIEQLLRASFDDLAVDVTAAAAYLRGRPEIDARTVGLLAQGGETMATVLAASADPAPAFVILLSTTALPGDETFRIEQHRIAQDRNYRAADLDALDAYVLELTRIVVTEPSPGLRAFQVRALLAETDVELPRNAAFPPNPEDQVRFFASTWWRDLFLFRPDSALMKIRAPALVLMGTEDFLVPFELQLPAIERSLEAAPSEDATVCLITGRIQHGFTPTSLNLIERWLTERRSPTGFAPRPSGRPEACVDPPRPAE
jgi:dienelactone hydrolase